MADTNEWFNDFLAGLPEEEEKPKVFPELPKELLRSEITIGTYTDKLTSKVRGNLSEREQLLVDAAIEIIIAKDNELIHWWQKAMHNGR